MGLRGYGPKLEEYLFMTIDCGEDVEFLDDVRLEIRVYGAKGNSGVKKINKVTFTNEFEPTNDERKAIEN